MKLLKTLTEQAARGEFNMKYKTKLDLFSNFKLMGTVENRQLYISDEVAADDGVNFVAFRIDERGSQIGYLIAMPIQGYVRPALGIKETWIDPEYRGQKLMLATYKALYSKYGYILISDLIHSPQTTAIWKQLFAEFKPDIVDVTTKQSFSPASFSQIYDNPKYVFILEDHPWDWNMSRSTPLPAYPWVTGNNVGRGILIERCEFLDPLEMNTLPIEYVPPFHKQAGN